MVTLATVVPTTPEEVELEIMALSRVNEPVFEIRVTESVVAPVMVALAMETAAELASTMIPVPIVLVMVPPLKVMGEALFNDGISIVLFVILFTLAQLGGEISATDVTILVFQQLIGSAALGLALGWITHSLLKKIDSYTSLIFITLGLVAGGYDLALLLGTSGPITIVVLGLFLRNYKWQTRAPDHPLNQLPVFWTLLDEFLNAALFVMMGLQILKLRFTPLFAAIGGIAIVVTLFGRWISVWIPVTTFRHFRHFTKRVVTFLTWGGLRGGISLALALTLPPGPSSSALLAATYIVVLFSTVVQGLTFRKLVS